MSFKNPSSQAAIQKKQRIAVEITAQEASTQDQKLLNELCEITGINPEYLVNKALPYKPGSPEEATQDSYNHYAKRRKELPHGDLSDIGKKNY